MSQRSPQNARYQKYTKPAGKTRKSAAKAKPKRASAAPGSTSAKPKTGDRQRVTLPPLPPDIRIWRYVWWGMLGAAIGFSLLAFVLRDVKPWNTVTLVIAYVLIFGGLAIDFLKVRPARQAQMAAVRKGDGAKAGKATKAEKAESKSDAASDTSDAKADPADASGDDDN